MMQCIVADIPNNVMNIINSLQLNTKFDTVSSKQDLIVQVIFNFQVIIHIHIACKIKIW